VSRSAVAGRSRADDDFDPNAPVSGQRPPSSAGGFDPNANFDPNAGADDFDPNAVPSTGALDLFASNTSGQATGGGFDPFGFSGGGAAAQPVPAMQPVPNGMPAPLPQAPSPQSDFFDPFDGSSGFISAPVANTTAPSIPSFQAGPPCAGMPSMATGYAAAFGGQPPYQAGAQYQQMPGLAPGGMPNGMPSAMVNRMPGNVPSGGMVQNGMQGAAFPQAFPQASGYQQAFGMASPVQMQQPQGFPQAQPQPQQLQQQAPRLEDLQQSLQHLYGK
jgi:hypothetical protein